MGEKQQCGPTQINKTCTQLLKSLKLWIVSELFTHTPCSEYDKNAGMTYAVHNDDHRYSKTKNINKKKGNDCVSVSKTFYFSTEDTMCYGLLFLGEFWALHDNYATNAWLP